MSTGKIMVGLSGGVDSAVAAFLLKEQGYDVAGATFRMQDEWDGAYDASAVAEFLGIPHYIFDFREIFKEKVLNNFEEEYKAGKTPNPCVRCNKFIKFPAFLEKAQSLGYDLISTGHYARTDGENIFRAKNLAKDQSYVMYNIQKDMIPHIRFPLADFSKDEIREIARKAGIPVAEMPDSQDICFIPDGDYSAYIRARGFSPKAGRFIGPDGEDLGAHAGVHHYTVGQRKGLGIAAGRPLFVKAILPSGDIQLAETGQEYSTRMTLTDLATPDGEPLAAGEYLVKIRSAANPTPCRYDGSGSVTFPEPVRAPAPGQSAVFYRDGLVYGGGIIDTTD